MSSPACVAGARIQRVADEDRLVQLMIAYQRGDIGAFEEIYALLADEVRRYFQRAERNGSSIQDLVQDTFLEVHRSRRTYTSPLPVRPWIFGIARNVFARSCHAARFGSRLQPLDEEVERGSEIPMAEALDAESAIEALPPSVGEPWFLHHAFGFSFESIAARLGMTPMAAKLRSSRATKALRAALNVQRRTRR